MVRPQPCRFFNLPGGCRRGADCTFSHDTAKNNVSGSSSRTPLSPGRGAHSTIAQRPPPQLDPLLPPGVCRFYWEQGNCKREFGCRYQHTRSPGQGIDATQLSTSAQEKIAPFLNEKGLAKVSGGGTDAFFAQDAQITHSLSPTEAHNRLKRFLFDNFKFGTTFQVYGFLIPLSSANTTNSLWTQEEGQLLLSIVASTNGRLRIIDIINWPQVSTQVASSRDVLSFQRGFLPLLRYMSSDYVVKSTLVTQANQLYMTVLQNLPKFSDVVEESMNAIIALGTFKDPGVADAITVDTQVFASIAGVLYEFLVRFKNAVATYPRLAPLVMNLQQWFSVWRTGIVANPPLFGDPLKHISQSSVRGLLLESIEDKIIRIVSIVEREQDKTAHSNRPERQPRIKLSNEAVIAALHSSYEGPESHRAEGPRHDNDFADIYDIRIAPTHEELMSRVPPCLPANLYDAPHHYASDSMQRLLDIQFRLLREELTAPLRKAVQLVHDDLKSTKRNKTKIADLLEKKGGKYRGLADSQESLMFNVYTGAEFVSLVPDWRGLSTSILLDTPPGRARSERPGARAAFWEGMSGKRLFQGGLIALVWESGGDIAVHLGVIASSVKDLTEYVKDHQQRVRVRVVFFDTRLELRVLQDLRNKQKKRDGIKLLVESPVMFEAIRPFLEALKVEPEILPFSRYLVHRPPSYMNSCKIEPPKYARDFTFQLASLFPKEAEVDDLPLTISDPHSIARAREELRRSRLDPSQADAVVDALTSEVALIQGPPGTGKSFTGVELLRVLKANDVGPILMIAFTNHALDHMLSSVLDADITKKIVRLGSRSSDERISQYSIETLEMVDGSSRLGNSFSERRRDLKDVQLNITKLMKQVIELDIESDSTEIMKYLSSFHPEHHEYMNRPPTWIANIKDLFSGEDDQGGWQKQGRKGAVHAQDMSNYAYWKDCGDLEFINSITNGTYAPWKDVSEPAPVANKFSALEVDALGDSDSDLTSIDSDDIDEAELENLAAEESWLNVRFEPPPPPEKVVPAKVPVPSPPIPQSPPTEPSPDKKLVPEDFKDVEGFLAALGYEQEAIPSSDRPLDELLENVGDVWIMSRSERRKLHAFWVDETRVELGQSQTEEFERLRNRHTDMLQQVSEGKEEVRRNLLRNVDIIGCTTTGAAKLATLLKGLSPRVLLVEEAGQVLEAHVLGSLVPSIEHLILIGDPLQLRPTLNNFSLSVDSRRGKELYRFDMSLMERLSSSGLAMSRIDVQRRMRPEISSLIRNTLYPGLEDHALVHQYPVVRGLTKNMFFLTHKHRENEGAEDSASKYNTYEVAMIRDLVLYLLRQGCYSEEGDIVVLCAYLGQLARLRDALASEVAIVIDERDQAALADHEGEKEEDINVDATIERVKVTKRVRLRTVDNYQGEEGRIVILSLVRNVGTLEDEMSVLGLNNGVRPTIGFLKSPNRTNVAVSRAREGLFIFGNAATLSSKSEMWRSIIEELEASDKLGPALPIACYRHSDTVEYVSEPGQLPQIAPDGGCMRPCNARLKCGHLCPFKCHSDDPKHVTVACSQPCTRLCSNGHPCRKQCATPCGDCMFPIANVQLPCGHAKESIQCYQLDSLDAVFCNYTMDKKLPQCEHTARMPCSQDPSSYRCTSRCGETMTCCQKNCNARCWECQGKNQSQDGEVTPRIQHEPHPCQTRLSCEHLCKEGCSVDHKHTTVCMEKCRQVCIHAACRLPCSVPCAPCQAPCAWTCPHHSCPVPCGSICVRLPCDKPCENVLQCGHRCPSVCGEDCDIQVCPECASEDKKAQVVDLIMNRSLSEVTPDVGTLDELLITNPSCRHSFTVETLDGHTGMNDFYKRAGEDGPWIGLKAPLGFKKAPTCPTCRSPITAPRYGRIVKRADLDILERNVAAQMSRSLGRVQTTIQGLSEVTSNTSLAREAATVATAGLPKKKMPSLNKQKKSREDALKGTEEVPSSERMLNASNTMLFTIDSAVIQAWQKATTPLFKAYKEVLNIAKTRSAHIHAWESAFSFLYGKEIDAGLADPARMPRRPEEHAMRVAKMQVGQPRPLADKRFRVEAFWCTLDIRLTLVRLARTWLAEVSKRDAYPPFHRQEWATYIDFLLRTCRGDAYKAYDIAESSEAHRQVMKTALFLMRIDLEHFRFHLYMCDQNGTLKNDRQILADAASRHGLEANQQLKDTLANFFSKKNIRSEQAEEEKSWVETNFTDVAQAIVDEWSEIERSIQMDTFYEPVSIEEKMAVVAALNFGAAGHFYQCPNGHMFVITECGGAMQRGICPECGAGIGGANHHLDSSNSRATEYDELARRRNPHLGASPWGIPY